MDIKKLVDSELHMVNFKVPITLKNDLQLDVIIQACVTVGEHEQFVVDTDVIDYENIIYRKVKLADLDLKFNAFVKMQNILGWDVFACLSKEIEKQISELELKSQAKLMALNGM